MHEEPPIRFEEDGHVAVVTMNRPQRRNVWSPELWDGLVEALERLGRSPRLRVGVLTGAGSVFSAGADLKNPRTHATEDIVEYQEGQDNSLYDELMRCPKPVIAAVNGSAYGAGATLAVACDLRVVSDEAYFTWPMVKLGLLPANGTLLRLARVIGSGRTLEIVLTGKRVGADEAYRIGLANQVAPAGEVLEQARSLAQQIAEGAPLSLRFIKESLYRGLDMGLRDAINAERYRQFILYGSADRKEASKAWLEGRSPKFSGR